jgi:hypothetical protein
VPLVCCNKRTIESLVKAGGFDSFGESRKSLWMVHEEAVDDVGHHRLMIAPACGIIHAAALDLEARTSEQGVERNFRVETLDFMLRNDPEAFNDGTERADLRRLVDGGALTIEQNGRELSPSDITNDFVIDDSVTMTFEKDPHVWEHNEDSALAGMDDALGNIMSTTTLTTGSVDPHTGEPVERSAPGRDWVNDFTGQYSAAYGTTRDYFGGELETFGKPPE